MSSLSFESRGRSRQISRIAQHQQPLNPKNNIRHHQSSPPPSTKQSYSPSYIPPPPPPSVAPLDSDDSSSPPSSRERDDEPMEPAIRSAIEDQLHIAYARDDILRAKILLLKLKGVEVSSDDDPRISQVQDEDFDICFIPNGGLVIEEQFCTPWKPQQQYVAQDGAQKRRERLRVCELVWAEQQRVSREEKARAQRRKAEEAARAAAEEERVRAIRAKQQDDRRRQERCRKAAYHAGRSVVNYSHLTHASPSKQAELFTYALPSNPSPPRFSPRRMHTSPEITRLHQVPSPAPSCFSSRPQVSFEEVLSSMNGALFPQDDEEPTPRPRHRHKRSTSGPIGSEFARQQQHNVELLDFLLAPPKATASSAGKQAVRPKIFRRDSGGAGFCGRCSAIAPTASSSSSVSSSGTTRSWFSFKSSTSARSSATSSSVSTAITTPSTSPPTSSWLKAAPLPSLLSSPASSISSHLTRCTSISRHHCQYHAPFRISVSLEDSPLRPDVSVLPRIRRAPILESSQPRVAPQTSVIATESASSLHPLTRRLTQLVSLAKSFQTAYISAAVFSAGLHYDVSEASPMKAPRFAVAPRLRKGVALNDGRRVGKDDVRAFLSRVDLVDDESDSEALECSTDFEYPASPARYIPLLPSSCYAGVSASSHTPCHTILPNPLPYTLHFKPEPQPAITPHRHGAPWRIRMVGNPVCLRLRAAKNRLGIASGGSLLREGRMYEGTEKLFSVAFDVRGESRLGNGLRGYGGEERGSVEEYGW